MKQRKYKVDDKVRVTAKYAICVGRIGRVRAVFPMERIDLVETSDAELRYVVQFTDVNDQPIDSFFKGWGFELECVTDGLKELQKVYDEEV